MAGIQRFARMNHLIARRKLTFPPSNDSEMKYWLPNPTGKVETSRLNAQHEALRLTIGGLTAVPFTSEPKVVVDVGCGTGIWAIEFALEHPNTSVIGVDLSPPSNSAKDIPPNCHFIEADFVSDWSIVKEHGPFDLIHARLLVLSIRDWQQFFQRCFDSLQPGGYLDTTEAQTLHSLSRDVFDANESYTGPNTPLLRYTQSLYENTLKQGYDPDARVHSARRLRDIGYQNVTEKVMPMPVCAHRGAKTDFEKKQGVLMEHVLEGMLAAFGEKYLANGHTDEEWRAFEKDVRDELKLDGQGEKGGQGYWQL